MSRSYVVTCDCGFTWDVPAHIVRRDSVLLKHVPLETFVLYLFDNVVHIGCAQA